MPEKPNPWDKKTKPKRQFFYASDITWAVIGLVIGYILISVL